MKFGSLKEPRNQVISFQDSYIALEKILLQKALHENL